MTAEQQLERSVLEGKERDELHAIAQALSVKTNTRTKKADIIDGILKATGVAVDDPPPAGETGAGNGSTVGSNGANGRRSTRSDAVPPLNPATPARMAQRMLPSPRSRASGPEAVGPPAGRPAQSFGPTDDADLTGRSVDLEEDFGEVGPGDDRSDNRGSNGSGADRAGGLPVAAVGGGDTQPAGDGGRQGSPGGQNNQNNRSQNNQGNQNNQNNQGNRNNQGNQGTATREAATREAATGRQRRHGQSAEQPPAPGS